jgi:hypothetical protein
MRARRTPMSPASAGAPKRAFVPTLLGIGLVVSVISSPGAPLIPTIARELHTSLPAAQRRRSLALAGVQEGNPGPHRPGPRGRGRCTRLSLSTPAWRSQATPRKTHP